MPLIGYVCPQGADEPGRRNSIEFCLGQCKSPCVMPPLLGSMWEAEKHNVHKTDYISASMLSGDGCPRQTYFERFSEYYDSPRRRFWPWRGTHAHSMVERGAEMMAQYGWVSELTMQTELQYPHAAPVFDDAGNWTGDFDSTKDLTMTVRGTCDAYNPLTRTLVDFKSMSGKKVAKFITGKMGGTYSPNLQDSWVQQLSVYAWLLARTRIPDTIRAQFEEHGLALTKAKTFPKPTRLVIQAIDAMELPHSGMIYPFKEDYGTTTYPIDALPVWTAQETEDWVRPRALKWYKWLVLRQTPPVVGKNKAWMCRNCPMYGNLCHPEEERNAAKAKAASTGDAD